MKLVVDMNLSPRWVTLLADAGFEATHWSNLGRPDAPDAEIMTYAGLHNCIVLTHDLDFGASLAATQGQKPSVVQIRADSIDPETIGRQIVSARRQTIEDLAAGALLTVDTNRVRLRLLPLRSGL